MPTLKTIEIKRMALGGDGVGHDGGKTTFVLNSLPGEVIKGVPTQNKKNFSRWSAFQIIKQSPDRQDPPCPYHYRPGSLKPSCGGCQWQHIKINRQRNEKKMILQETLEHIGGFKNIVIEPLIYSDEEFRYRNKVQIPFSARKGKLVAGFYAPESHTIVEFDDCLTQSKLSVKIFDVVKKCAAIHRWRPYQKDKNHGWLRHVVIRSNQNNQAVVVLVTKNIGFREKGEFVQLMRAQCPEVVGIFQNVQPARSNVILGREWIHLWGLQRLSEKICGMEIEFSPETFMQVNTSVAEKMYEKAISLLFSGPAPSVHRNDDVVVLDFYSGLGITSFLAAKMAKQVYAIEEVAGAVRDGEFNMRKLNIKNVQFFPMSSERFVFGEKFKSLRQKKSVVILDPPRSGCEPGVLNGLKQVLPERIVYISCHPATLARDLKILSSHYKIDSVTPVDLFPQTAHIESIALLNLKK